MKKNKILPRCSILSTLFNNSLKSLLLVCLFCFLVYSQSFAQNTKDSFYYGFNGKIRLIEQSDKFLIKYSLEKTNNKNFQEYLMKKLSNVKYTWKGSCLVELDLIKTKVNENMIDSIKARDEVVSMYPMYKTKDSLEVGITDELILNFKPNVSKKLKNSIIRSYRLKLIKETDIYGLYSISKNNDILTLSNELYETGLFECSYPNIICKPVFCDIYPNDPYFPFQITLNNTGQVFNDGHTGTLDADIDATEAWELTTGSSDITVAVIDAGVTADQPDLPNSRQVRLNGSNFGSVSDHNDPSPTDNVNHGNACAGIIAATMNNNEGIAGIAPNCKIMPIRMDVTASTTDYVDAIMFAADNGADVISISWGWPSNNNNDDQRIANAIQYAVAQGRGGYGCVVTISAGNSSNQVENENSDVLFPANVNIPGVLTVGASDRYDQQANYSATSNLIDIVAPSHRAYNYQITGETYEMWTLDIPNSSGDNPWHEYNNGVPQYGEELPSSGTNYLSYTGRFGGTSYASAVVAGVAALMLSINPSYTQQEVYDIMTTRADKVGNYTYTNGHSNEMGYGRVNAYRAVCHNTFVHDITYSGESKDVIDCCIDVQNVTVTNNGNIYSEIHFYSYGDITINGAFEVQLGSTFTAETNYR